MSDKQVLGDHDMNQKTIHSYCKDPPVSKVAIKRSRLNSPAGSGGLGFAFKGPKVQCIHGFQENCSYLIPCKTKDIGASYKEVVPKEKEPEQVAGNSAHNGKHQLAIQPCVDRMKVQETLKLFFELHKALSDENKAQRKTEVRVDLRAASELKRSGKWINTENQFGHIPGILIGDQFHYRAELVIVGLHRQYFCGIDYLVRDGKKLATSIVDAGRYDNESRTSDVMIYSGQGGQEVWSKKEDQKLEKGNLALVNSMEQGQPIRVIKNFCISAAHDGRDHVFIYDGLYNIKRYWQQRAQNGRLIFKFKLHRLKGQGRLSCRIYDKFMQKECCVANDISQGEEAMPIRAFNGIDGERPPGFTYLTSVAYPEWCKQLQTEGCSCTNGCSSSAHCLCAIRNGGELPFDESKTIMGPKTIVFECGSNCKCPHSCRNRVTQHGPHYKLEIFKTESEEWGVRSRSYISSGSFVCEYVGKLQKQESKQKTEGTSKSLQSSEVSSDEDKMKCIIDCSKFSNVGRFIRESNSPNLFVQQVFYDKAVPHVMLFASMNIPPLKELTHQTNQIRGYQCNLLF